MGTAFDMVAQWQGKSLLVRVSGSILWQMLGFGSGWSLHTSRKHRIRKASTSSWGESRVGAGC